LPPFCFAKRIYLLLDYIVTYFTIKINKNIKNLTKFLKTRRKNKFLIFCKKTLDIIEGLMYNVVYLHAVTS